jgi:hypothetical protein
MSVSIQTYIANIIEVLIKVVLPDLNSGFARIQLSFAIDLLNQLQNQVEYRNDVMRDDFAAAAEMLDLACATLQDNRIGLPEEMARDAARWPSENPDASAVKDVLSRMEAVSAKALDRLYENAGEIKNFIEIEEQLLEMAQKWVNRKARLQAPTINLELLESA